jgi:NADH-quinone oxidoreductase subunit M
MVAMMSETVASVLLPGLPLLGALLSLALWSQPDKLKICSIATAALSLGAAGGLSGYMTSPAEGFLFVYLLPIAAITSLLGQPAHPLHRSSWVMTLVFLGLGLGVLTHRGPAEQMFMIAVVGLAAVLLYRHHTPLWPMSWWGIGLFILGLASAGTSLLADPPLSSAAFLLSCAILLPLVPLHGGYLAALTRLPGNLPPFLAVLLPAAGLHGLASSIQTAPEAVAGGIAVLAVGSGVYGAVKALAQSRVRLRLAYGSLSFFSILWWFMAATRSMTPSAAVFVGAVALVTSGLLVSWQVVRTRYGDDVDPQSISGLASAMPSYAVLVSLLALAAIGLPPFGVFAGFVGLLLSTPVSFSIVILIMLLVWLAASWYVLDMVQRLLFGTRRSNLRYTDLRRDELASLLLVVLALLVLGVIPAHLVGPGTTTPTATTTDTGSFAWKK